MTPGTPTFAVVGCGNRGGDVYARYLAIHPERGRVVAVADPDAGRRDRVGDAHAVAGAARFESGAALLAAGTAAGRPLADVLVVATPDRVGHHRHGRARAAVRAGDGGRPPGAPGGPARPTGARAARGAHRRVALRAQLRARPLAPRGRRQPDAAGEGVPRPRPARLVDRGAGDVDRLGRPAGALPRPRRPRRGAALGARLVRRVRRPGGHRARPERLDPRDRRRLRERQPRMGQQRAPGLHRRARQRGARRRRPPGDPRARGGRRRAPVLLRRALRLHLGPHRHGRCPGGRVRTHRGAPEDPDRPGPVAGLLAAGPRPRRGRLARGGRDRRDGERRARTRRRARHDPWPGYSGGDAIGRPFSLPDGAAFAEDFHVYAIDWSPAGITWSVDGVEYSTVGPADLPSGTRWVYDHPFFLILNVAVGGNWPGYPDATTAFPQELVVDYVRVYQAPDTAERFETVFRDEAEGWVRVQLPFDAFERADAQPDGAPDDGFGRTEVWGLEVEVAGDGGAAMLDQLEWYRVE